MMLALRNKQLLTVVLLAVLTLVVVALVALSVAHFNIGEALKVLPAAIYPYN